jgi:dipeptidyl aminopeptidase/acylaminoacyl peptidase
VLRQSTRRTNEEALTRPRGAFVRFLHVRGFVPGFAVPAEDVVIRTRDGVTLAGTYLPGPGADGGPAVVVFHGFGSHRRKPAYALLAERLSRAAAVLTIDLRGHGRSGGASTLGLAETLDVMASRAWLRRRGHAWVGAVGVSMGATAVLRAAGTAPPGAFDAVCTVSAVSCWGLQDTPAMRQLTKATTTATYRMGFQAVLGVRIAVGAWPDAASDPRCWPIQPVEAVAGIAPSPLLLVHGLDDHYFGAEQAAALHAAAGDPVELWLEPEGFGHAEDGLLPVFADRLTAALCEVHTTGRWPTQARSVPLRSSSSSSWSNVAGSSSSRLPSNVRQNAAASR